MVILLIIIVLMTSTSLHAQEWIDDDAPLPLLDAVELYRTSPLSLHTASVDELQTIPGFSRTTALRLRATFRRDTTLSLDDLADTLCLAPSQRVLLHVCCSRTPPSPAFVRAAAARVRVTNTGPEDSAPTTYARAQVATGVGTASLLIRDGWRGGSLDVHSEHASLLIGTLTVTSGMGLVLGAPLFLGKGASLDAPSRWSDLQLSSWRSAPSANIVEGVAAVLRTERCSLSVMHGRVDDLAVQAGAVAVRVSPHVTATSAYASSHPSRALSLGTHYQRDALTIAAECAFTSDIAASAMVLHSTPERTLIVAARHIPASWTIPTAAPFADGAGRNETGILAGMRTRIDGWNTTAWLDVFRTHAAPYGMPTPRATLELFVETEKRIARNTYMHLRGRYESSTQRVTTDTIDRTLTTNRDRILTRFSVLRSLFSGVDVRIQAAAQYASFERHAATELSWMSSLELRWEVRAALRVTAKCQTFHGASMHTTLYSFDYRVPGSFGSTPLLGSGARWLLSATWQPLDHLTVSAAAMSDGRAVLQLDVLPLAR